MAIRASATQAVLQASACGTVTIFDARWKKPRSTQTIAVTDSRKATHNQAGNRKAPLGLDQEAVRAVFAAGWPISA